MERPRLDKESFTLSTDLIIENIKSLRDNKINDLLKNDDSLNAFLEKNFDTIAISSVKREFLKRDLIELKNASLDLAHYAALIKEPKKKQVNKE